MYSTKKNYILILHVDIDVSYAALDMSKLHILYCGEVYENSLFNLIIKTLFDLGEYGESWSNGDF